MNIKEYKIKYKKKWEIPKEMANAIAPDWELKEKLFIDKDCAEVIWLNFSQEDKKGFSKKKVTRIVELQREYLFKKQNTKQPFIVWDMDNIKWLDSKVKISPMQLLCFMEFEGLYFTLIGC